MAGGYAGQAIRANSEMVCGFQTCLCYVISIDQREWREPLMQSAMPMFVSRFASRELCILPVAVLLLRAKYMGLSASVGRSR